MSFFAKPISQIDTSDLVDLLDEKSVENVRLEFKREAPKKDELLKKLSSFANTFGGYAIVGAEAKSDDGRLVALPGVDPQPSYKQTVVDWCFKCVTPPLDVEVSDPIAVPAGNEKVCYVLYTAESEIAPHFLNGRKGVYVRTDEFSSRFEPQLATENELRSLFDRRKLVRERRSRLLLRARDRFHIFAATKYREFKKADRKIGCSFNLSVVPRFPVRKLIDHAQVMQLLKAKTVNWRGVQFPTGGTTAFISQHESAIALGPFLEFSILEANVWGLTFYATEIQLYREQYSGIYLDHFLGSLLVCIRHAVGWLEEIRYTGPLHVEVGLESMRGVPWVYSQYGAPMKGPASELDNEVIFSIDSSSETFVQKPDRIAMDILEYILFAMNWLHIADSEKKLTDLIKAGYKYNLWRHSGNLQS